MKNYSLYLFDFDGTLFDTLDSLIEVYKLAFLKYGVKIKTKDCAIYLQEWLGITFNRFNIDKKYYNDFLTSFAELMNTKQVINKTKLYEDTLDLFKYVNEHNINIGIVTGSPSYRVIDVLNFFNISTKNISVIVGCDNYKHPKPDKEPLIVALKKVNYLDRKNEVLYVGDALQDIKCANAAEIDSLLLDRKNGINLLTPFKNKNYVKI